MGLPLSCRDRGGMRGRGGAFCLSWPHHHSYGGGDTPISLRHPTRTNTRAPHPPPPAPCPYRTPERSHEPFHFLISIIGNDRGNPAPTAASPPSLGYLGSFVC